jgi:hypothetical protein
MTLCNVEISESISVLCCGVVALCPSRTRLRLCTSCGAVGPISLMSTSAATSTLSTTCATVRCTECVHLVPLLGSALMPGPMITTPQWGTVTLASSPQHRSSWRCSTRTPATSSAFAHLPHLTPSCSCPGLILVCLDCAVQTSSSSRVGCRPPCLHRCRCASSSTRGAKPTTWHSAWRDATPRVRPQPPGLAWLSKRGSADSSIDVSIVASPPPLQAKT